MSLRLPSLLVGLLTCLVLLGSAVSLNAQVLTGTVTDESTNLALPGATVLVEGTTTGAVTDVNGKYTILGLKAGQYTIKVSFIGYESITQSVTLTEGTTTANFTLKDGVLIGDEVLVLGDRLRGQAAALNQQRTNTNITNIVAADQIGRFPDANIGDAMKRIPGITMQYDQGEARFGLIRGTEPRLNSVTINGERVPSAEGEVRNVQLDLIPADMIQTIEVNKAVTPDMDADAIGGSVNLVTRAAPNGTRISGTAASGYNFLSEKPIWTGALVVAQRFMDNKLGVVLSGSYNNHNLGSDNVEAEWAYDDDPNDAWVQDVQIRKYDIQRIRRSVSLSLDYKFTPTSSVFFRTIYNHRDDWENRYRLRYLLDDAQDGGRPGANGLVLGSFTDGEGDEFRTEIRRQTKGGIGNDRVDNRRLEDQRTTVNSLGGNHLLGGKVQLDWSATFSRASEERPNERYVEWRARRVDLNVDLDDPREPQVSAVTAAEEANDQFELREITEEYQFTRELDYNGRIDLTIPLQADVTKSNIKTGFRIRYKDKNRTNNFFEYEPLGDLEDQFEDMSNLPLRDYTDDNYLAGPYAIGQFTTPEYLGSLNLANSSQFEESDLVEEYLPGNYTATETITGGYAMLNQELSSKLYLIAGVRLENTQVDYTGNQLVFDADGDVDPSGTREVNGTDSYVNVLPGIHLKYDANPNTVVRVAWTNTLARPNYIDIVPFREVNLEDNELREGNPELLPTTSMNFDVMVENYFESIGLVSGGVFYKDINDFIFEYTEVDYTDPVTGQFFDQYQQSRNGSSASLFGIEVAFQRQLDFLPGALKGLGIYANYTYTGSSIDGLPVEGRNNEDLQLPGTAEHTLNASLSFETKKLVARLSLNYTSAYIDAGGISSEAFNDIYYDAQTFLDFNASYAFTPQWRFFLEANNLTNQPLRYFQGREERTFQAEFYNVRFNAGVRFDLFKR